MTNGDDLHGPRFRTLVAFEAQETPSWVAIPDGVMGGLSQGSLTKTPQRTGVFSGILSLENGGGFASVRADVGLQDLSEYTGLEVRVRGDGRTYQLRLRTDGGFDGIAYTAHFETVDGSWVARALPFSEFVPTFRGRVVHGVPELDVANIQQIGLLLADGRPGPFRLEVDAIRAVRW